ncbi:MAG: sodium:proton antiporter [Alphaproteobacteria bacterium]|mgnify:CR=1 FL=1|jgi:monovalent cation:H+ antiporter, CPA1 family|nr:sodium:proton antiporter [Rhodospirillaceae bacterium]MDG2482211.1 sodium:proton antiporter [Alphaproteobacteria bacterium]
MRAFFDIAAVIVVLAAVFGYLNHKTIKLPHTVGLVVIALAASLVVLAIDALVPGWDLGGEVRGVMASIDFSDTLMEGLLSFLLFAGALHVDLSAILSRKWVIVLMATVGTVISTFLIGGATWLAVGLLGLDLPLIYCLVFGALIAPTDPVAVLGILKRTRVPPTLEAKIAGESLFNDGVGIVIFTILAGIAAGTGGEDDVDAGSIALLFVVEALGGVALGLITGFIAFKILKTVDEHNIEVMITLALVMGGFALAHQLHVSGPIAMVCAGLLIGNLGTRFAMSEVTREHTTSFWSLIDEILNSALFLLIGFEVVAITLTGNVFVLGLIAIPVVLASRFVSVAIPVVLLKAFGRSFTGGAIRVLTWGGLRGGISVALVLSLPATAQREILLTVCYMVVLFSIIVQGLSMEAVIKRIVKEQPPE